ncbi:MAG: mechanosensitive ion channel family protein [Myxococcota bacterium]
MSPKAQRTMAGVASLLALAAAGAWRLARDQVMPAANAVVHPAFAKPPTPLATPPLGAQPHATWDNLVLQVRDDKSLTILLIMLGLTGLLWVFAPREARRLRSSLVCYAIYVVTLPVGSALLSLEDLTLYGHVRFVGVLMQYIAVAGLVAVFGLEVLFWLLRSAVPVILRDIILAGAYIAIGLNQLSNAGFNISGIIATSAVLTAVIGFSLQDSLGNIMSGVVLELEDVINAGDWVKIGDVTGRVRERRWRQTTIETRDWDIVVIPNSVLMKNQVVVYGKREGKDVPHRQWIYFSVDLAVSPSRVIDVVTHALRDSPMERVAVDPAPNVVMMDFKDGVGVYAARYFLTDLAPNDPTDTIVRERIYYALQRAGIRLASPTRNLLVTEDNEEHRQARQKREHVRRVEALLHVDIFKGLERSEVEELAEALTYMPFGPGEVITRQGDVSDSLYLMVQGTAAVTVVFNGLEKKVAELKAGSVFGEMGVLTGEPRSATVHAATSVEAWRLGQEAFHKIIERRPEIAQELSLVLAMRKEGLLHARENLSRELEKNQQLRASRDDIMARISKFLRLGANA